MVAYKNDKAFEELSLVPDICEHVESIARDIRHQMKSIFTFDNSFRMPKIVLDDSCPVEHIGSLDFRAVQEKFRKILGNTVYNPNNDTESLNDLIARICDTDSEGCFDDWMHGIRRKIDKIFSSPEENLAELPLAKKVSVIINKMKMSERILGKYYPNSNKIILYYNNIGFYKNNSDGYEDFFARLTFTLAHEMYHAMHYFTVPAQLYNSTSYHSKVVKEASAEFYAFLYCLSTEKDILIRQSKDAYYQWKEWFISPWPYAKALYYLRLKDIPILGDNDNRNKFDYNDCESYGSIRKLVEVLNLSVHSMDAAYFALVYDESKYFSSENYTDIWDETFDGESAYANPIVKFSIIHHSGVWRVNSSPVRYAFNWKRREVIESHYKNNPGWNTIGYYVDFYSNKCLMDELFNTINSIDWDMNYNLPVLDSGSWEVKLTYANGSEKVVTGNVGKPVQKDMINDIVKEMYDESECPNAPIIF